MAESGVASDEYNHFLQVLKYNDVCRVNNCFANLELDYTKFPLICKFDELHWFRKSRLELTFQLNTWNSNLLVGIVVKLSNLMLTIKHVATFEQRGRQRLFLGAGPIGCLIRLGPRTASLQQLRPARSRRTHCAQVRRTHTN